MRELELYGIIPRWWSLAEDEQTLFLVTDVASISLPLTRHQREHIKHDFEIMRKHVGREWCNGVLCIPAKEHGKDA